MLYKGHFHHSQIDPTTPGPPPVLVSPHHDIQVLIINANVVLLYWLLTKTIIVNSEFFSLVQYFDPTGHSVADFHQEYIGGHPQPSVSVEQRDQLPSTQPSSEIMYTSDESIPGESQYKSINKFMIKKMDKQ